MDRLTIPDEYIDGGMRRAIIDAREVRKHAMMTNAQDNAQIELMDAQTQGQLLNNIMNVAAKLDNETVIRSICDILDIDYEEVKKNISSGDSLENAQQALGGLIPEGDSNNE